MNTRAWLRRLASFLPVVVALGALAWAGKKGPDAELVSVLPDGSEVEAACYEGSVSDNGKFVVFGGDDADFDGEGPGGSLDEIWLKDIRKGTFRLLSVGTGGVPADGDSWWPAISGNGRVVVFDTDATNLGPTDANGETDIYAYDVRRGTLTLVSRSTSGAPGNGWSSVSECVPISKNGRFVVFHSEAEDLVGDDTNGLGDIFVHDLRKGTTMRVSVATDGTQSNGDSWYPAISANGRFVSFVSAASNLVDGDTNENWDVFVHDVRRGTTTRASVAADGTQGDERSDYAASVSNNGRFVAFDSAATNLVPGDTNGARDIFLKDMRKGTVTRVSVRNDGTEGSGDSWDPSISSNGKVISFWSYALDLTPGPELEWEQYVYDVKKGVIRRALTGMDGEDADGSLYWYRNGISTNGKWAAGSSRATNHVEGDDDTTYDVILVRVR